MTSEDESKAINWLREQGVTVKQRRDGSAGLIDWSGCSCLLDEPALNAVAACRRLRELNLSRTSITDEQLVWLIQSGEFPELLELQLSGTIVTALGLEQSAKLPKLKMLVIRGCPVSLDQLRDLRKRLINTRIVMT